MRKQWRRNGYYRFANAQPITDIPRNIFTYVLRFPRQLNQSADEYNPL